VWTVLDGMHGVGFFWLLHAWVRSATAKGNTKGIITP
jgi:hypothetical protein